MKKIKAGQDQMTISVSEVRITFSKEISYWGKDYYYENPKFTEFWDKVNSNPKYEKNLWYVAYCSPISMQRAEEGKLPSHYLRFLVCGGKHINISTNMHAILVHEPNPFPTIHIAGIENLFELCSDCAEYCGGTVEFTYSTSSRYFLWKDAPTRTVISGKGIRNFRVKNPKRKKQLPEVDYKE